MGQIDHPELTGVDFARFRWLISERGLRRDFRLFARVHQRWLGQFSCFFQAPGSCVSVCQRLEFALSERAETSPASLAFSKPVADRLRRMTTS